MAIGTRKLPADIAIPPTAKGVIIFAHGRGSGRRSSRNRRVAANLNQAGFATILFDLLTEEIEEGRALYKSRVAAHLYPKNFYDRALVDCAATADSVIYYPSFYGINMMFNEELDGSAFGARTTAAGEACFNTSMEAATRKSSPIPRTRARSSS